MTLYQVKEIPGYESMYTIDTNGIVQSLARNVVGKDGKTYPRKGRIIKHLINTQSGYVQISLWKNNKGTWFYIHRLLAELFIDNPENKPEVNHINSNRADYSLSNLEWVTSTENSVHAYKDGHASQKHRRKLTEDEYLTIFNRFLNGESFSKVLLDYPIKAARLSVNLRKLVSKWGKEVEYKNEIARQRRMRVSINGKSS